MKKKFKTGQAIVFEPQWADNKRKGVKPYRDHDHPLKYGAIVHFLAYHEPAFGHCIVTTYEGQVITMLHPGDFRKATEDEV